VKRTVTEEKNEKGYFVHESSYVDEPCEIGEGTRIWHFSHIMSGCRIGRNCNIGQNAVISPGVILGNNVKIQNNVSVYTGVICEDDVFLGPSAVFTNVVNPRSHVDRKNEYRKTIVMKGASIGANATIICGHNIGRYALVGAGAVVTKDIPDFALVVGNPARITGWVCKCGVKLTFPGDDDTGGSKGIEASCQACGASYIYIKEKGIGIVKEKA
jgi:UDP-2-acetamido-3-amino-2,3-dideoxy-glucuronate N-acetyltransferase